jgi:hypothetical protein
MEIYIKTRLEGGEETVRTIASMKKEIRDLRGQMATASDEELVRMSQRVSSLNADMARSTNLITSSGSAFTNFNTVLGRTARNLLTLDFAAAADNAKLLNIQAKQLTFKELTSGIKSATAAVRGLSTAILANPILLLGAVVIGLVVVLVKFKDEIGFVGDVLDFLTGILDTAIQWLKDLSDAFGLTSFSAIDAANRTLEANTRMKNGIVENSEEIINALEAQIIIQRALGNDTLVIENAILLQRRQTANETIRANNLIINELQRLSTYKRKLNDDEIKLLNELKEENKKIASELIKINASVTANRIKELAEIRKLEDDSATRRLESARRIADIEFNYRQELLSNLDNVYGKFQAKIEKIDKKQSDLLNERIKLQLKLKQDIRAILSDDEIIVSEKMIKDLDEKINNRKKTLLELKQDEDNIYANSNLVEQEQSDRLKRLADKERMQLEELRQIEKERETLRKETDRKINENKAITDKKAKDLRQKFNEDVKSIDKELALFEGKSLYEKKIAVSEFNKELKIISEQEGLERNRIITKYLNDESTLYKFRSSEVLDIIKSGNGDILEEMGFVRIELEKELANLTSGQFLANQLENVISPERVFTKIEQLQNAYKDLARVISIETAQSFNVIAQNTNELVGEITGESILENLRIQATKKVERAEKDLKDFNKKILDLETERFDKQKAILNEEAEFRIIKLLRTYQELMKAEVEGSDEWKKLNSERAEALTQIHFDYGIKLIDLTANYNDTVKSIEEQQAKQRSEINENFRKEQLKQWEQYYKDEEALEEAQNEIRKELSEKAAEPYANFHAKMTDESLYMSAVIVQNLKRISQATSDSLNQVASLKQQEINNLYAQAAASGEVTQAIINDIRAREEQQRKMAVASVLIDSALAVGNTVVAATSAAKNVVGGPVAKALAFAGTMATILPKVIATFASVKSILNAPSIVPDVPGGTGGFAAPTDAVDRMTPSFRGGLSGLSGDLNTSGGQIQGVIITDGQLAESEARRRFNLNRQL